MLSALSLDSALSVLAESVAGHLGSAAPTLQSFESAAQAAYNPELAGSFKLRHLCDGTDEIISSHDDSGVSAFAFLDERNNLIVAYQGAVTGSQECLDATLMCGLPSAARRGLDAAVNFYGESLRVAQGLQPTIRRAYVTGLFLGGVLASYVASETGAGGVSFFANNLPKSCRKAAPAANFVSLAEDDKGSPYLPRVELDCRSMPLPPRTAHYGTVICIDEIAKIVGLCPFLTEPGDGFGRDSLQSRSHQGEFFNDALLRYGVTHAISLLGFQRWFYKNETRPERTGCTHNSPMPYDFREGVDKPPSDYAAQHLVFETVSEIIVPNRL